MSKIKTMDEALDLIRDGAVIASSGFIMAGTAESVLRALGERFGKTGHPRGLTCVFSASEGDGKSLGYDHLAQDGMIDTVIGGHFGLTPRLGDFISAGRCRAYNYPLGVVTALYRNAIQRRPGEVTKIGLKTFIDPRLEGGRLNSATTEDLIRVVEFDGSEWLYYPTPKFDVAIIRGTTGDADGNISMEHEAVWLDMKSIAMAVKAAGGKVIVQVKNLAAKGTMPAAAVEIPGIFVDAVVLSPDPMAEHRQTRDVFYDPSLSGRLIVPMGQLASLPLDLRKVIARRCAMELVPGAVINLGIGVPEGVAAVAAEEGFGGELTMTAESGVIGGIPCGGGAFGAGQNAMGYLDMRATFDFYDGGGLDLTVLGLAEANAKGDINVSKFGPKTPGCGGFINISQNTGRVVFCGAFTSGGLELSIGDGRLSVLREGKNKKFVKQVQQVTYSGEYGASIGQKVLYVTERAVFRLTRDGIELVEIAPGADLERDVLGQMEFRPLVSPDLRRMDERLFRAEKMGFSL